MTFELMKLNKQRGRILAMPSLPAKEDWLYVHLFSSYQSDKFYNDGQTDGQTDAMLYTPDPLNGVYNVNSLMSNRVRYITFHTALNEQNVNVTLDSLYSTSTINYSFIIPNFLLIERLPCLVQMIGQVNGDV